MSLPLSTTSTTHPGLLHPKNEDSHAVFETVEGGIALLVCDGMGGMGRGDEASQLAVRLLRAELEPGHGFPPDRLRHALRTVDDELRKALCVTGEGLPGSTAVIVYVMDGGAHVAWVGDSRAYHLRRGRIIERTRDHKLVEELVDSGQLTPAQAKASALAHVVTRALGGRSVKEPTVRPGSPGHVWKLYQGDRLVVMSDGICDLLDDDEIAQVGSKGTVDEARDAMVTISLERGGHDNITCVVAEWTGPDWVEEEVATPVMRPGRELDDLLQDENTMHPDSLSGPDTDRLPLMDPKTQPDPDDGRVTEEIANPLDAARAATPPPAPATATSEAPPTVDAPAAGPDAPAAAPPPAVPTDRHPPDPGGVPFDWRFLAVVVGGVALLIAVLGWFTRR